MKGWCIAGAILLISPHYAAAQDPERQCFVAAEAALIRIAIEVDSATCIDCGAKMNVEAAKQTAARMVSTFRKKDGTLVRILRRKVP